MPINEINFYGPAKFITAIHHSFISKKGPYIAAYLGRLNKDNPHGQVYYIRPFTRYDEKNKRLVILLSHEEPTIHQNDNRVSKDIKFRGKIIIDNFEYGKSSTNQEIYINIKVFNNTKLPLRSVQIHNGVIGDREFPFLGKIAYFIFSTKYWKDKKSEYHKRRVSVEKLIPATDLIYKISIIK